MINIHYVSVINKVLQGDYAISVKAKTTQRAKPFLVRLPSSHIRQAYEQYCSDNMRSLDAQSSMLITKELQALGYLPRKPGRMGKKAQLTKVYDKERVMD